MTARSAFRFSRALSRASNRVEHLIPIGLDPCAPAQPAERILERRAIGSEIDDRYGLWVEERDAELPPAKVHLKELGHAGLKRAQSRVIHQDGHLHGRNSRLKAGHRPVLPILLDGDVRGRQVGDLRARRVDGRDVDPSSGFRRAVDGAGRASEQEGQDDDHARAHNAHGSAAPQPMMLGLNSTPSVGRGPLGRMTRESSDTAILAVLTDALLCHERGQECSEPLLRRKGTEGMAGALDHQVFDEGADLRALQRRLRLRLKVGQAAVAATEDEEGSDSAAGDGAQVVRQSVGQAVTEDSAGTDRDLPVRARAARRVNVA